MSTTSPSELPSPALTGPTEPIEAMRQPFDKRRQAMHGRLTKMAGVTCLEPEGPSIATRV